MICSRYICGNDLPWLVSERSMIPNIDILPRLTHFNRNTLHTKCIQKTKSFRFQLILKYILFFFYYLSLNRSFNFSVIAIFFRGFFNEFLSNGQIPGQARKLTPRGDQSQSEKQAGSSNQRRDFGQGVLFHTWDNWPMRRRDFSHQDTGQWAEGAGGSEV